MQAPPERRHFRRFDLSFDCLIRPARKRKPHLSVPAQTIDISRGGLYFLTSAEWEVGTELEYLIQLPRIADRVKAVSIRCHGKIVRVVREESTLMVGATIRDFAFLNADGTVLS